MAETMTVMDRQPPPGPPGVATATEDEDNRPGLARLLALVRGSGERIRGAAANLPGAGAV